MFTKTIHTGPLDFIYVYQVPPGFAAIWDRAGDQRFIPTAIIRNAREVYEAGLTLKAHGALDDIPAEWGRIWWDQCKTFKRPRAVQVTPC